MSEHNSYVWTRRRCLLDGNSLGQPAVLFTRRSQTVLCVETLLHQTIVPAYSQQIHAILHTYLVWGLDVFRMLPRRSLQLFCNREYSTMLTLWQFTWIYMFFFSRLVCISERFTTIPWVVDRWTSAFYIVACSFVVIETVISTTILHFNIISKCILFFLNCRQHYFKAWNNCSEVYFLRSVHQEETTTTTTTK